MACVAVKLYHHVFRKQELKNVFPARRRPEADLLAGGEPHPLVLDLAGR
jgi:hypothetical protein